MPRPPENAASLRVRAEVTGVLHRGLVLFATPAGRVVALRATDGERVWTFDPRLDLRPRYLEGLTSRGVAVWADSMIPDSARCHDAVFSVAVDARLFKLDARSGQPCRAFGNGGELLLADGAALNHERPPPQRYSITSPPVVVGRTLIVGSSVQGGLSRAVETGVVRGLDATTGAERWRFDGIPRAPDAPGRDGWKDADLARTGGANVWSLMAADPQRDLVFLPTGGPSPNHIGANRRGANRHANSIVALRASSGAFVWAFQLVHHDLWDYDVASQPVLVDAPSDDGGPPIPALVAMGKPGMLYVLNRETGQLISRVEERSVPRSDLTGEESAPRQPFTHNGPLLHAGLLTADSIFGATAADRRACLAWFSRLRYDGLYTPPSAGGTLVWPGVWGGPNWDGAAWDPLRRRLFVTIRRLGTVIRVTPRSTGERQNAPRSVARGDESVRVDREPFVAPSGLPCTPPPWSALVAVDLSSGEPLWATPLGHIAGTRGLPGAERWGSLAFGSPVATATGLVFVAASQDDKIRALDAESGAVLWEQVLPAGGQAGPMTFLHAGEQYLIISAGGRAGVGSLGDWVVAFTLQ